VPTLLQAGHHSTQRIKLRTPSRKKKKLVTRERATSKNEQTMIVL
jgi:hypothetical protein